MVNSIEIQCPFCAEKSELFLSISPSIIMLNCPECWTPLLYYNKEVRILSEGEFNQISAASNQNEIKNLFDKIEELDLTGKNELRNLSSKRETVQHHTPFKTPLYQTTRTCQQRTQITDDDIVNLRIALAQSYDVSEIIEKL